MQKLSDTTLRKLKPKEISYTMNDGDGLSLIVNPIGSKLWVFRYTSPTTLKRNKISLNNYPDVSLADARKKADEYKELVAKGIDPIEEKRETKRKILAETKGLFASVINEWFKMQKKELATSTYTRKVSLFDREVKPFFKGRLLSTIKHPEIVKLIEMKAIKTPDSASRLLFYLNDLWQYATMKGYCDFNIITNIHKKSIIAKRKKKNYSKITEPMQLQELIKAIYTYKGSYSTKNALKFVIHLPLRADNLVNLKWEQIDLVKKLLTIPRHLMKVKDENANDFIMPLTPQVIEILQEQRLFADGIYVFKTDGYKDAPISAETPNRALERLGFNDEAKGRKTRLHGFRGTLRSLADTHQTEHNTSHQAKERALDHLPKNVVERAYTHKADYIKELDILMSWWSNYLDNLMKKKEFEV